MATALAERLRRMSLEEFWSFYEARPDEERWELYDGSPLMMTPVFPVHNRIGSNLEHLLNDGLAGFDPTRIAYQRLGIELPEAGEYRPEPDVVVVDYDLPAGRYPSQAYLLAEIVSSTDRERVPWTGRTKVEAKREIYRQHAPCEAVLTIEQDRVEVLVETRIPDGWTSQTLTDPEDDLALPTFGLRCRVGDLYANTPLRTRQG